MVINHLQSQLSKNCLQPASVKPTTAKGRALSTTHLYTYKWKIFESWHSTELFPKFNFFIILFFLQECLHGDCVPSTLQVFTVVISDFHSKVDRHSVDRNGLLIKFLRGTKWLSHPSPSTVPTKVFSMSSFRDVYRTWIALLGLSPLHKTYGVIMGINERDVCLATGWTSPNSFAIIFIAI